MEFKERYSITAEVNKEGKEKTIISVDTFAIGEMLEKLMNKIEHLRISTQ